MRIRSKIILLLVAVGVVVVISSNITRDAEPSYQGKPLSRWLVALGEARVAPFADPQWSAQSATAIRSMGTNSMPFLIQYSQYTIPAWRVKWKNTRTAVGRWFGRDWNYVDPEIVRKYWRSMGALEALGELGTNARPAVPALLSVLNDRNFNTREKATNALRKIAPEVLTNAPVR